MLLLRRGRFMRQPDAIVFSDAGGRSCGACAPGGMVTLTVVMSLTAATLVMVLALAGSWLS
jgi:hypothetical protein